MQAWRTTKHVPWSSAALTQINHNADMCLYDGKQSTHLDPLLSFASLTQLNHDVDMCLYDGKQSTYLEPLLCPFKSSRIWTSHASTAKAAAWSVIPNIDTNLSVLLSISTFHSVPSPFIIPIPYISTLCRLCILSRFRISEPTVCPPKSDDM